MTTDTQAYQQRTAPPDTNGLEVRDVVVRFDGVVAVDHLPLVAPIGAVTGLIGPNGAGKTTTFNVCSGLQAPTEGTIHWRGDDITSLPAVSRAQRGLGRTFQHVELFDSMTVAENVALGRELGLAGSNPVRHVIGQSGDRRVIRDAVTDALERCGIEHLADQPAAALSTGHRRLVELARALAGDFDLLLLDEPSAGLDKAETERFGEVLQDVRRDRGIGLLIVEHDVPLVLSLCDHVYVLDFGKLLFEGTPDEVRASTIVRDAYLGKSLDV